ncbi:MAG: SDR family oxidoreductase [Alphaproteobacteria bacterium]|nr:SDR family oxidoreductase [Alphaproteobacteria bacterium]
MNKHLFIFGLGYSARFLAKSAMEQGWKVSGTCQSAEKKAELEADDIGAFVFDRQNPFEDTLGILSSVTHILCSVPPDKQGEPIVDLIGEQLSSLKNLEWIGYLSTTGVYGDRQGALVDETAERRPSSDRSQRRMEAEDKWFTLHNQKNLPVHIFRLPGIYGPGYSTFDRLKEGKAKHINRPGHNFSRIHVDDIAQTLWASMNKPNPGRVYNLSDDEAAPPSDLITFACNLLCIEPPTEISWEDARQSMSPMALSFWQDNRRIDNSRIKEELGIKLKYPDYRIGLTAIFETTENQ